MQSNAAYMIKSYKQHWLMAGIERLKDVAIVTRIKFYRCRPIRTKWKLALFNLSHSKKTHITEVGPASITAPQTSRQCFWFLVFLFMEIHWNKLYILKDHAVRAVFKGVYGIKPSEMVVKFLAQIQHICTLSISILSPLKEQKTLPPQTFPGLKYPKMRLEWSWGNRKLIPKMM